MMVLTNNFITSGFTAIWNVFNGDFCLFVSDGGFYCISIAFLAEATGGLQLPISWLEGNRHVDFNLID